jgi:hypothetical protein
MQHQSDLGAIVTNFTVQLVTTIERTIAARIQAAVSSVVAPTKRRPGRPRKNGLTFTLAPVKNRSKQLCPVPGCQNPAAPVFGMVCAKHKDLPKAQIKKYREARRTKKAAGR